MKEVWKDIVGYEGYYQVSNLGRVRSLNRLVPHGKGDSMRFLKGKILNQTNTVGYKAVGLRKNNKVVFSKVHRLLAIAFIPNPEDKPCVNHIDMNRSNNIINNLEWCTYSENTIHFFENGRKAARNENHGLSKLSNEDVVNIKSRLKSGEKGITLAKEYVVTTATISRIKNGKIWNNI